MSFVVDLLTYKTWTITCLHWIFFFHFFPFVAELLQCLWRGSCSVSHVWQWPCSRRDDDRWSSRCRCRCLLPLSSIWRRNRSSHHRLHFRPRLRRPVPTPPVSILHHQCRCRLPAALWSPYVYCSYTCLAIRFVPYVQFYSLRFISKIFSS